MKLIACAIFGWFVLPQIGIVAGTIFTVIFIVALNHKN